MTYELGILNKFRKVNATFVVVCIDFLKNYKGSYRSYHVLYYIIILVVVVIRIDTLIPLGFQHRTIGDDIGRVICDAVLHTSVFPSI